MQQPTRLPLQIFRAKQLSLLVAAFFALLATKSQAAEVIPPKPDRYFNDYAGVVSKSAALRFNEELAQFERETSDQLIVAIFQKMQSDSDIADYTQRVAQAWGVGQKERRNGVVLFVFVRSVTAWKAHCPTSPRSTSPNTESNRIFALAITKAGSPPESIRSLKRFAASTRDQVKLLPNNIVVVALRTSGSSSFS